MIGGCLVGADLCVGSPSLGRHTGRPLRDNETPATISNHQVLSASGSSAGAQVVIELPRHLGDALIHHARDGKPHEVCGIVGIKNGRVVRLHRARNVSDQPQVRFEIDPDDLFKVVEFERVDLKLGFYHSHPASRAYPSSTDIAFARLWPPDGDEPPPLQLMISLRHDPDSGPELHAYRIVGDTVTEEELLITDD